MKKKKSIYNQISMYDICPALANDKREAANDVVNSQIWINPSSDNKEKNKGKEANKYSVENSDDKKDKALVKAYEDTTVIIGIDEVMTEENEEDSMVDLTFDTEDLFNDDSDKENIHFEFASDALIHCMSTYGRVDISYISTITGISCDKVISSLKGAIYQNPETWQMEKYEGWEVSDEYLSGNLAIKLKIVKEANKKYNNRFSENRKAIEKLLPSNVSSDDIYVTLGSPWVPTDVIDDFLTYLLGDAATSLISISKDATQAEKEWAIKRRERVRKMYRTLHDEFTGTWEIPEKGRYYRDKSKAYTTYSTKSLSVLDILEKTLNMQPIVVWEMDSGTDHAYSSNKKIDQNETIAALEKQKIIINEFKDWIWKDEKRKSRLEKIYTEKYCQIKRRVYDGSFLKFPTLSKEYHLYQYQKDAIARIIFTPNTLLAHDVGAGKTYVMIAAGQELRRMNLSKKNMYVVPNNIIGQWKGVFSSMYPNANILCVDPKSFKPNKREEVLLKIKDNDYDGIIIAYSCFTQIPLSKKYFLDSLSEKIYKIKTIMDEKRKVAPKLRNKKAELTRKLDKLKSQRNFVDSKVCFDELGITRLFVDEAHNFKNVPIETKTTRVLGINSGGSKRCQDMMDKVHCVQKNNGGKGVILATGTPIANSIVDAFVMQQYLQSGELSMLDLHNFDSWIGMFAEKVTEFEIDVDTSSYRLATRFARFHNLPELTSILSSVADFHGVEGTAGIPVVEGYSDTLVPKSEEFEKYLKNISKRADQVRNGVVSRKDDNMLKITTDGRKAALDIRLAMPKAKYTWESKVGKCATNVSKIYFETSSKNSTQIIFCDTSTPKAEFNIYDELKKRLMMLDVPKEQIVFIHDANTEAKKEKLFAKVRNGEIRILIGSTFKLGLGVNVQNKLIAIHHIDVPWRPADMTQREGRILRQGNENKKVKIFRYITEGSFDAYSWQLLETKQKFISDLLSGAMSERNGGDIVDTVLNYAEVKALAVGNPLVKERVELANEISKYLMLERKLNESKARLARELSEIPRKIKEYKALIEKSADDKKYYDEWEKAHPSKENDKLIKVEAEERKNIRNELAISINLNISKPTESYFMCYRGFDLILPANMDINKPYIWIERSGRYYLELGSTDVGNLVRIDNFLNNLKFYLLELKTELNSLTKKKRDIENELSKEESYAPKISECKKKLMMLDLKLGAI